MEVNGRLSEQAPSGNVAPVRFVAILRLEADTHSRAGRLISVGTAAVGEVARSIGHGASGLVRGYATALKICHMLHLSTRR